MPRRRTFLAACCAALAAPLLLVSPACAQEARPATKSHIGATPLDRIRVPEHFRLELLYSVPKEAEGSWVSMCVDPKGRLIVCDQYGGLFRVTPPPAGQTGETRLEKIEVDLGEAQGLLWAFDSLYVVVNRGKNYPNGLYRVTDADGDDRLDKVEKLRGLDGPGGEHGPHAVVLAPDGKSLYVVIGNQIPVLADLAGSKVPRLWGEDHLLPRMPDGRGFMKGVLGPGGNIYQVSPDGKEWVQQSTGYRNHYDAAFNRDGELFTFDADMEWDLNTPWYRPTRVLHAVSGAEFGWRNGAGKWPAYYPDSLPAAVNIGVSSPTGIAFGYGAKFPARFQDALYLCDWTYGKLYAVTLTPAGASYTGVAQEFVTGSPLPLTDVVVNPHDGAMYFTIGGRRTQSGLYRVTYAGPESTAEAPRAADPFAAQRRLRHELEAYHGAANPEAVAKAWPHLSSPDRFLRWAARVAIEHQPIDGWKDKALAETEPTAALEALLALARAGGIDPFHRKPEDPPVDAELKGRLIDALGRFEPSRLTPLQQLTALRVYEILFNRFGGPDEAKAKALGAAWGPLLPSRSREINAELANVLVYLQWEGTAAKLVPMCVGAATQEEQIEYARALRMLKVGWTPPLREAYFQWFNRAVRYRGGASFALFVANIRKDAEATLTDAERAALKPILEAAPSTEQIPAAPPRPFVKEWGLGELAEGVEGRLKNRDFDRGRAMFAAANCFACHRFDGEGGANGPDLTGAGGRFSPRDLLESIVEPSKVVSDQYEAVSAVMSDGRVITGRIAGFNNDQIWVMPNMLDPGNMLNLERKDIEELVPSKTSMMPAGLLNTLRQDEVDDLLAYVLSRGDRNHGMFKR